MFYLYILVPALFSFYIIITDTAADNSNSVRYYCSYRKMK